jgi:hypothetical protein
MVHYIRFLSPPQVVTTPKKSLGISVTLAVTTDLGDTYLADDTELLVRVLEAQSSTVILQQSLVWKATSRALKASILCNAKYVSRSLRVHVTTAKTQADLAAIQLPQIMDVWSKEFKFAEKERAEPVVARELPLSNGSWLQIWEETGDSIARHVWDASLSFLVYIDRPPQGDSQLHALLQASSGRPLQVLELGTGCGTVGIAFAQLYRSHVVLTDLEDAMDILQTNLDMAKALRGSSLRGQVLDWGSDLEDSFSSKYDLILVSDCIYNPDSSVRLVTTLLRLVQRSPGALIVVGFKRRHAGDDVFFEHMSKSAFIRFSQHNLDLPHIASDYDAYEPIIEFHTYTAPVP